MSGERGESRGALPPLTHADLVDLFRRRRDVLRTATVEVVGFAWTIREVPARLRLEFEDALAARGRFEGMPWHERIAFVLSLSVVDGTTREPILASPFEAPDAIGELVEAGRFVGELPAEAVVELFGAVCELNRLGREGVDASAGESEGGSGGASSSDSPDA
ncbi:MAG: hypothetical protein DCC71_02935 [Proteobacteria bacterium]|nr:MAG: hypothetical protein DCC71_02935 [Pseudomonadota bacterium]